MNEENREIYEYKGKIDVENVREAEIQRELELALSDVAIRINLDYLKMTILTVWSFF